MEIRPDDELRSDVLAELRRDPKVHADEIAVRAERGIVWLVGSAETPLQRTAAEHAVERVTGALFIDNRLTPRPPGPSERRDSVLRAAALQVLADRGVPVGDEVDVEARGGRLTVTGRMPASVQRDAAVAALSSLPDVVAVKDEIRVPEEPSYRR
jgi:osmotically-inducible protein OsmY